MADIIAISPKILIELSNNDKFCKAFPKLCERIKKAPGVGFPCCKDKRETIAANKYWNNLKKEFLKFSTKQLQFVKDILGVKQLYIRYLDEFLKEKYVTL